MKSVLSCPLLHPSDSEIIVLLRRLVKISLVMTLCLIVGSISALAQNVSLSTTSVSFPNQIINTTSKAKIVTLTNTGTLTLTISSITTTGNFAQTNTCGTSLAAGTKCTISVTFTPTITGTRTGTLTVTDNAANSPQTASLSGKGNINGLVSIAVTPANPTLNPGATQQLVATGTFNTGTTYD